MCSSDLASQVQPGDVCLDIGANTGYYTALLARHAMLGAVHAFEPVPLNWHLLNSNVMLNDFANVHVNHCALGKAPGTAEFSQAADAAFSSLIAVGRRPEAKRFTVTIDTLDAYLARHSIQHVHVIKLDVEGAEKLVIEGAQALFSDAARRPRKIGRAHV